MSNRRKATPAELELITAAREGDRDRLHDAPVEMQRDPKRWFCSATETGIPRVYGRGDTRAEAEANVRSGVRLGPKAMSAQRLRIDNRHDRRLPAGRCDLTLPLEHLPAPRAGRMVRARGAATACRQMYPCPLR